MYYLLDIIDTHTLTNEYTTIHLMIDHLPRMNIQANAVLSLNDLLPRQWGILALHVPKEVHSVSAVPLRTKPLSQVNEHREPKWNSPWGDEQTEAPPDRGFRVGHRFAGRETERQTAILKGSDRYRLFKF